MVIKTNRSFYEKLKSFFARLFIKFGFGRAPLRLLLKHVHLFDHLDTKQFDALVKSMKPSYYGAGNLIFDQGEVGDVLYLIKSGSVAIFTRSDKKKEIVLARLEAGDYFGEQALINEFPGKRSASAKALNAVTVYTLPHKDYFKILSPYAKEKLKEIAHLQLQDMLDTILQNETPIKSDLFAGIIGKELNFSDGDIIFKKDEISDVVYFIISGKVIIEMPSLDGSVQRTELEAGKLFGELGVLNQKRRVGTAIARGNVILFAIGAETFKQLYDKSSELQELVDTHNAIYHIPYKGTVTLRYGTLLNRKALIALYHLENGATVSTAKVIESPIFTMAYTGRKEEDILQYTRGVECRRTLHLANRKICAIMSIGPWPELSEVCQLLLKGTDIDETQVNHFRHTGRLTDVVTEELSPLEKKEILCYCLSVTKGQVYDVIAGGVNRLEDICRITGAGNVCGCCRPKIVELLGLRSWITVRLLLKKPLSQNVSSFRFLPIEQDQYVYQPGQYIIIQGLVNNQLINRAYTLTSVAGIDQFVEITVRREEKGIFSSWLFDQSSEESLIRISEPQGNFILETEPNRPIVFFAAGIGITPAIAFARTISLKKLEQRMHVDFSSHAGFILKDEWQDIILKNKNISINYRDTAEQNGKQNRLQQHEVSKFAKNNPLGIFYICGPQLYQNFIVSTLKESGISDCQIKIEKFVQAGGPEVS